MERFAITIDMPDQKQISFFEYPSILRLFSTLIYEKPIFLYINGSEVLSLFNLADLV